jgi:predicted GIY-YIG superfamily endonuclease
MTIGIYALYWEEQDLIYIGESDNIERRFKEHLKMLETNKHFNYRVQEVYNTYGLPLFQILEECHINELKIKEVV